MVQRRTVLSVPARVGSRVSRRLGRTGPQDLWAADSYPVFRVRTMTATGTATTLPSLVVLADMPAIGASVMSDLWNEVSDIVSRRLLPGDPVADVAAADATSGAARRNRALGRHSGLSETEGEERGRWPAGPFA